MVTTMIAGIGNDIAKISKFDNIKESFKNRVFTSEELAVCKDKPYLYAANFSVKEAVSKAFGTGVRGFELNEIEVLRDKLGKPYVNLYGKAKQLCENMNISKIFVSISDLDDYVITMAVVERE